MLDDNIVFQNLHKVIGKETELPKRFSEAIVRYFNLVQAIRGANQEEPSVNCKEHRLNYQQEMATKNDENVFASPWNDSDLVLIVEDQELHVHRSILTLLSPVFKAMLDGHFKEASEDKITLKEKNLTSMVLFLKVLYPPSIFKESRPTLNDESRLSVMALAEEYQCVNLIKHCIDEVEITPENVLPILPYAAKYNQTALARMFNVINWSAPASKLKEVLPTLENKDIFIKLLLTKCSFLETSIVEMQDGLFSLIYDRLPGKEQSHGVNNRVNRVSYDLYDDDDIFGPIPMVPKTACDSRCGHAIAIREINETKNCSHCKEKYKEKFFAPIPACRNTQHYFDMLQRGNDIMTAVKQKK